MDNIENLTYKALSMFHRVDEYCHQAKSFIKVNDDVWINMKKLMDFTTSVSDNVMYGLVWKGSVPDRSPKSKYYVSYSDYHRKTYPDYLSGPAYLVPAKFAGKIVNSTLEHSITTITDDVLLTGIVADQLRIPRIHSTLFLNIKCEGNCDIYNIVSIHLDTYQKVT